jgi:hypothetical protein
MARALAHAYLHRNDAIPSLRGTLMFVTDTCRVVGDLPAAAIGNTMTVIGVSPVDRVAYVVEELGGDPHHRRLAAPIVYKLSLDGPREGHLVPIHVWYEPGVTAAEIRARIAAITPTLAPVTPVATEAWMLSTRVIHHRALRIAPPSRESIRKFALELKVEPVARGGAAGRTTVTAFLAPNATLATVWMVSADVAIARVTYTGIPSGLGLSKDTLVLLT